MPSFSNLANPFVIHIETMSVKLNIPRQPLCKRPIITRVHFEHCFKSIPANCINTKTVIQQVVRTDTRAKNSQLRLARLIGYLQTRFMKPPVSPLAGTKLKAIW